MDLFRMCDYQFRKLLTKIRKNFCKSLQKNFPACEEGFRGKQISKINIFEAIILKQNEGMRPMLFLFFDDFGTFSPFFTS